MDLHREPQHAAVSGEHRSNVSKVTVAAAAGWSVELNRSIIERPPHVLIGQITEPVRQSDCGGDGDRRLANL